MAKFPNEEDFRLVEKYLANELDAAGVAAFEDRLKNSPELRSFFVEYANMELAIKKTVRDQESLSKALAGIATQKNQDAANGDSQTRRSQLWPIRWPNRRWQIGLAASLLFALLSVGWWTSLNQTSVAWVVNAQNCQWDQQAAYRGNFPRGQLVNVDSGLLEIAFASQASVVVEGPAALKILSDSKVEIFNGAISVKMPKGLSGFEVYTPKGRVLDLGTEFGVSVVGEKVNLSVFDGEVVAVSASEDSEILLRRNESALIERDLVKRSGASQQFVREISNTVRTPKRITLSFNSSEASGVKDAIGQATGLTRMQGTGGDLPERDDNLKLDTSNGILSIKATRSDINHQLALGVGEYLGKSLSELGFTGAEDFEVAMRVVDVPELLGTGLYGQYGIYVAEDKETSIRGGVILWSKPEGYRQFLVNTDAGVDRDGNRLGYISPGSDIEITLRRINREFSLEIRDLDTENSNTLKIKHPGFLDSCNDFQVGIFVANPFHDDHATIKVDQFNVTVWHETKVQ